MIIVLNPLRSIVVVVKVVGIAAAATAAVAAIAQQWPLQLELVFACSSPPQHPSHGESEGAR